jgi:hypothetical protein
MLFLKFWSTMRMREISGLDSQSVKWPLDCKYEHALIDFLTQNALLLLLLLLLLLFYFFKYITVMTRACLLNYHLFTLTPN